MSEATVTISYNDFKKMELVVGLVTSVQPHPNADKLYLITVNLGTEERQLVAGLKPYYTAEELKGKYIVVLANLEPRPVRGVMSQGMLLAAQAGDQVVIISPERPLTPGAKVL